MNCWSVRWRSVLGEGELPDHWQLLDMCSVYGTVMTTDDGKYRWEARVMLNCREKSDSPPTGIVLGLSDAKAVVELLCRATNTYTCEQPTILDKKD